MLFRSQSALRRRRGRRTQSLTVGGEQRRIDRIVFGTLTLRQSEVTDLGWIDNTHRHVGGMKNSDQPTFVATGSLADHVCVTNRAQELDQSGMSCGSIGQRVLPIGQVELEGDLGNVQANIDGRFVFRHNVRGVRAHSCTYERAFGAALSTVRVTDTRHERLRLPDEHVKTVPEGNERARADANPPAGGLASPSSCSACSRARKMKEDIQEGRGEGFLLNCFTSLWW